jgi:pimeloyl-ACP methyl ester carboxylesterase
MTTVTTKLLLCIISFSLLCVNAQASDWDSSGTVKTPHGELHYRIAGVGKPLLLLHGYSGYGGQWRQFLSAFTEGYRVIAVDLPGHGQSSKLGNSFDVANAASDMWHLMDHLGVKQIHGVGYSAGGMTLLQMALIQPSRIVAMTLAASAVSVPVQHPRGEFEELPKGYRQDLLRNHNEDMEKIRSMLKAEFVVEMDASNLKELKIPTLLVSGDRDESFPLAVVAETYTALPNARLWIVPDVGHALFWPWGGSERLAAQFPEEVLRFFDHAELNE